MPTFEESQEASKAMRKDFLNELKEADPEEKSALIDEFLLTGYACNERYIDENMDSSGVLSGSPKNRVRCILQACIETGTPNENFQSPLFSALKPQVVLEECEKRLKHKKDLNNFYSTFRTACNILDNGGRVTESKELNAFIAKYRDDLGVSKNDTMAGMNLQKPIYFGDYGMSTGASDPMERSTKHLKDGAIVDDSKSYNNRNDDAVVTDADKLEKIYEEYKGFTHGRIRFEPMVEKISNWTKDDKDTYSIGIDPYHENDKQIKAGFFKDIGISEDYNKANFEERLHHDFISKGRGEEEFVSLKGELEIAKSEVQSLKVDYKKAIKNSIRQQIAPGIKKPLMASIPGLKGFTTYGKVSKAAEKMRDTFIEKGTFSKVAMGEAKKGYQDSITPKSQLNGGGATPVGSSSVKSGAGEAKNGYDERKGAGPAMGKDLNKGM